MAQKHVLKLSALNNYFKDEMKLIENALESGHVINMNYNDDLKVIKGRVHASMKDKQYNVEIYLDQDKNLSSTSCTCPRGQVSCHYVAALGLFAHYNVSVTDQSCSWSALKKGKPMAENVKTVDEMFPQPKEYRASTRSVTDEELQALREKLGLFGGVVGFSWLVSPKLTSQDNNIVPQITDILFSAEYHISNEKSAYFEEKARVSPHQTLTIFHKTVEQSKNPLWLIIRRFRLTASLFGAVLATSRRNRYPPSLFKKLTGTYNLDGVKAIQWGREHEAKAIEEFSATTGLSVTPAGIWLDQCGYLGATPDGLVGDEDLLEVKCPFKYRNSNIVEILANEKHYICSYDKVQQQFVVNESHEYFHQIQGALHLLNKKNCHMVIWTPQVVTIIPVAGKEEWAGNIQIIKDFYLTKFLPHLMNSEMK